jgi:hypothetical protein
MRTCEHPADTHGVESGHESPTHGWVGHDVHNGGAEDEEAGTISYVTDGT